MRYEVSWKSRPAARVLLRPERGGRSDSFFELASIARSQQQTYLRLWRRVQPHARGDRNLPSRMQDALRHREFGSRDRRLYRELLYTAVRYLPWIEELTVRSEAEAPAPSPGWPPLLRRSNVFREALLPGWPEPPALISGRAQHLGVNRELLPDWFRSHCPEAFASPNLEVLHTRAPIWIRLQSPDPAAVSAEFASQGWTMAVGRRPAHGRRGAGGR